MNKPPFRLFHLSRSITEVTFGSIFYSILLTLVSGLMIVVLSPLLAITFLLELPQAILSGSNKITKFFKNLGQKPVNGETDLLDKITSLQYAEEMYNKTGLRHVTGNYYNKTIDLNESGELAYETFEVHLPPVPVNNLTPRERTTLSVRASN